MSAANRSGRAVLFGDPVGSGPEIRPGAGSRSLFSAPDNAGRWRVKVACSGCGARTPVALADVVRRLVQPTVRWCPVQRHPHRLTCPACGHLRWCRLSLPVRGGRR